MPLATGCQSLYLSVSVCLLSSSSEIAGSNEHCELKDMVVFNLLLDRYV